MSASSEAWQFLPVRVRIRQRLATSLTPFTMNRKAADCIKLADGSYQAVTQVKV